MLKTHKFARRPFYVDAVRVSENNITEVAEWCKGVIMGSEEEDGPFIKVEVHRPINDRQTEAHLGDWILESGNGFKVYTPKAFDKSFEKVKTLTKAQADEAGIKVPHEPRPKNEQKKRPVPTAPKKGPREIGTPVLPEDFKLDEVAPLDEKSEEMQATEGVVYPIGTPVFADEKGPEGYDPGDLVDVVYRDAKTGQYVTEEVAEANPDTTVAETDKPKKSKADLEAEALIAEVDALREK